MHVLRGFERAQIVAQCRNVESAKKRLVLFDDDHYYMGSVRPRRASTSN
jgi:hypothetical protein